MHTALTLALEREGWEVHHQVEDPSASGPALEDDPTLAAITSDEGRHEEMLRRLQRVDAAHAEHKRALILFCSHIGGHKYAGNVIVSMRCFSPPIRRFESCYLVTCTWGDASVGLTYNWFRRSILPEACRCGTAG